MMPRIVFSCIFLLIASGAHAQTAAPNLEAQRQHYATAVAALRAKDEKRYHEHLKQLDGYVLRGYAQYEYQKDRLDKSQTPAIRKFMQENAHTPLAESMRQRWL